MSLTISQVEKIFDEGYCFVDLLSYIEYREEMFILADGSLGKVWKIAMFETEGKPEAYLKSICSHIENLFNGIPNEGLACQILLRNHGGFDNQITRYKETVESPGRSFFAEGKIEHILLSKEGFKLNHCCDIQPRQIDCYLSVRFFPQWNKSNLINKTFKAFGTKKNLRESQDEQLQLHHEEFAKIMRLIEGILQVAGVSFEPLDDIRLMNMLYGILNPSRSKEVKEIPIKEDMVLREQILYNSPISTPEGFSFEDYHYRLLSLKELSAKTTMGMFSRELFEGTRFCVLDCSCEMMVVINFTVPPLQETVDHLNNQKSFAFLHQKNWLGDKSVEAQTKKDELEDTIKVLFKSGQKVVKARIHFIVGDAQQDKLDQEAGKIINVLSRLGCEGIKEQMIGASLFLTCLPLNFDPYFERFIGRSKRVVADNAADMMPLYGSFQGTKTPSQLYLNRRGEIVFIDFFDSNINPHGVVIGASGAGKSFFMNDFILQNERLGAHFFVLDKGDSYKKLSSILQGQYISFDLNHPVRINPFMNEPSPENLSFLMSLLSQMASGGDERDRLTREEEGLLQKAVIKAYEQKTNDEITLSSVVSILNNSQFNDTYGINSVMGPTLALRLTPFTTKGPYGGFFDGKNEFQINGRFTVFELANLSAYPDLQLAVLLNLMFFMTAFVSNPTMKPKRKYLLIDEAWSLLKVKNTADFITNAFKTFRKFRCSVVAITQELADLTRHESGLAIVANASNKVFLKQEASLIDLLKDRLSLSEDLLAALKSVETHKGRYSEAFVITDSNSGIIRLIPDPILYWAANSEPRNNEYLAIKVGESNGDILKAIHQCAKEFPYGIK